MMKRYDSYKDSGVEWIGEIPGHWGRKRLKHISESVNGYSFKSDDFDREYDVPVIRIGDVGESIDFTNCVKVKSHFLVDKSEFLVKKNDILIGLTGGTIGKSGRYNYDSPSLLNQRVGLLRNKDSVLNGLLHHYVNSEVFIRYIFFDCYGGGQDNISMNDILNMVFPFPPLSEQQQIVSFLDTKTSLIDSLIEKTQRKIELLKEKRTSLINEVVTKGLNPNVEMKDSGVEWIGKIPSHWDSPFFGLISNLQQGLQIPFDYRFFEKEEGMFEYITTKSVHNPNDPKQYILNPKKSVVCVKDEILYGRTGNTGEVITNVEGVFHNNFFKIDYDKNKLVKEYLIYQLTNSRFRETILLLSGTTTIPDLNHGDFNSMRCLIPPIKEQQQIVEYLDEQTQLIDKTIFIEEKRIELLKEYRQSLISEVVTGKLKVTTDE